MGRSGLYLHLSSNGQLGDLGSSSYIPIASSLLYVWGVSEAVWKILYIRVSFWPNVTILVKPKDQLRENTRTGVVYIDQFQFANCPATYVGQTSRRSTNSYMQEHHWAMYSGDCVNLALAEHVRLELPSPNELVSHKNIIGVYWTVVRTSTSDSESKSLY